MRTWSTVGIGMLSGLIVMMGSAMMNAGADTAAHAAGQGADGATGRYVMAVGGATQNQNDLVWVLNEHKPNANLKRSDAKVVKPDVVSLCLYKAAENGKKMQLVGVRDIAYDIEMFEMNQESPTPTEIIKELSKNLK